MHIKLKLTIYLVCELILKFSVHKLKLIHILNKWSTLT